jgi:hypothetical protein
LAFHDDAKRKDKATSSSISFEVRTNSRLLQLSVVKAHSVFVAPPWLHSR